MDKAVLITCAVILLITNLISFLLMFIDKRRAEKNAWRIPEKTLFLAAGCFGALGGTIGMHVFHHKTKHWYFRWFFPIMLVVQAAVLIALYVVFNR